MIVDDSIPLHALIKAQLGSDDLVFHSCYDGADAVSAAAAVKPDLILLDIDMPNMDGFEACQRIKADPATAAIPLMFLSAESTRLKKDIALAMGAFDYLQKPFKPDQLKSAVRSKLQSRRLENQSGLIDPATGLWNRDYFEVQLREQYVLANLSARPISCVVTEIDQLGSIGVRHGNKIANQVFHGFARILADSVGPGASLCSLPNRRFATLYPNCDRFAAKTRCRELQKQIKQKLVIDAAPQLRVTCSCGVCDNQVAKAMTLFDRASDVLRRAMDRGGDRVAVSRCEPVNLTGSMLH
jgi:diguanylate cyclase (GGDEF)-like protein